MGNNVTVKLTAEESHPLWKRDLESAIRAKERWCHVNGTAIEPRPLAARSESTNKEDWYTKVELHQEKPDVFDIDKSTAKSMILKRCDTIHESSIRMIDNPKGA